MAVQLDARPPLFYIRKKTSVSPKASSYITDLISGLVYQVTKPEIFNISLVKEVGVRKHGDRDCGL